MFVLYRFGFAYNAHSLLRVRVRFRRVQVRRSTVAVTSSDVTRALLSIHSFISIV